MVPKTPLIAVDGILKFGGDENKIVLIKRKNYPKGLALPGGFVEIGEKVEDALKREIKEETNLEIKNAKLFGVYSDPKRDPRFHVVSCVFVCEGYGTPKGGDDAADVIVLPVNDIQFEKLAFDHKKILKDYIKSINP